MKLSMDRAAKLRVTQTQLNVKCDGWWREIEEAIVPPYHLI